MHITEICDHPDTPGSDPAGADPATGQATAGAPAGERPNLVIGVATTDATVPDARMTEPIHAELARRGLLPGEHLLDSGYPSAQLVLDSHRRWGVALVSPLLADHSPG